MQVIINKNQIFRLKQSIQRNLLDLSVVSQQRAYNGIREFIDVNMLHLDYETPFIESINNQIIQNHSQMDDLQSRLFLMKYRFELLNIINNNFNLSINENDKQQIRKDIIEYLDDVHDSVQVSLVVKIITTFNIHDKQIQNKICQKIKQNQKQISNKNLLDLVYDLDQANIHNISLWNFIFQNIKGKVDDLEPNRIFKLFCSLKSINNQRMLSNKKIRSRMNDLLIDLCEVFIQQQTTFPINIQVSMIYDISRNKKMYNLDDEQFIQIFKKCVQMIEDNSELLYQMDLLQINKLQQMINLQKQELDGGLNTPMNISQFTFDELVNQIKLNSTQLSSKIMIIQNILNGLVDGKFISNEKFLRMYGLVLNEGLIDQFQLAMILQNKKIQNKQTNHKFFRNLLNNMYDNMTRFETLSFIKGVQILDQKIEIPEQIHNKIHQKMMKIHNSKSDDHLDQIYIALYDKLFINQQTEIEEDKLLQLIRENRQYLETNQVLEIMSMGSLNNHYVQYFNQTFRKNMIEINMNRKIQIYRLINSMVLSNEHQSIFYDEIVIQDLEEIIETKQNQLSLNQICVIVNMIDLIIKSKVQNQQEIVDIKQIQQSMIKKIVQQKTISLINIQLLLQGKQYFDDLNTNLQKFIINQLQKQNNHQIAVNDLLALNRIAQIVNDQMLIIESGELKQTVKQLLGRSTQYFSKKEMDNYLKLFI